MAKRTQQTIIRTASRALCCAACLLCLTACNRGTALPGNVLNEGVEKNERN